MRKYRIVEVETQINASDIDKFMDNWCDAYWNHRAYSFIAIGCASREGTVFNTYYPALPQFVARWLTARILRKNGMVGYIRSHREVWITE